MGVLSIVEHLSARLRDGGLEGDIVRFSLVSPYGDMYPLVQSAIWDGGASQKVNLSDRVAVVLPLIVTR